jgi:hypothetical protein
MKYRTRKNNFKLHLVGHPEGYYIYSGAYMQYNAHFYFIISKNINANEACNVAAKAPFEFISYDLHLLRMYSYLSLHRPITSSRVISP